MTESARPILFIAGNRLGDAVLASGVLARLMEERPEARVTIACGALPAPLFADVPRLDRIIAMRRRGMGRHWMALWAQTAGHRWDTVADMRGSIFGWTVWARRRWVSHAEYRHEHRIEEIARQFGLDPVPAPKLWISPERSGRVADQLGGDTPILAIAPTSNWGGKQWPAERFAETVRRLTAPGGKLAGARVLVSASANERPAAQPVLDAIPVAQRIDWIGMPDLLDLAAVFARCRLFIGNDSGLMHLAAASGAPTLGLFGPSREWRYRPWGEKAAFVRTPESHEALTTEDPSFKFASHDTRMGSLTIDAVVEAAEALLART
ncbi:MAG TPA: glycosyltransferase family 9 protein [Magnetospirillaceae bacterium]